MPRRHEIYVELIRFRASEKRRPWIVVTDPSPDRRDPRQIVVGILPMSTAMDLLRDGQDFVVYDTDPDFSGTGLDVCCYVIDLQPVLVDVSHLRNKRGELRGALLDDFKRWAGDA